VHHQTKYCVKKYTVPIVLRNGNLGKENSRPILDGHLLTIARSDDVTLYGTTLACAVAKTPTVF